MRFDVAADRSIALARNALRNDDAKNLPGEECLMYRLTLALLVGLAATPAFAGDIKVINDKAAFPEGPAFVDGKLHYVEYGGNTIDVWDGKTNTVLWKSDGCGPSAVLPLGAGDLVVTCYDNWHHRPRLARRQDGGDLRQGQGWRRAAGPERLCGRRQGRRLFHGLGSVGIGTDRRQGLSLTEDGTISGGRQRLALCQRHRAGRRRQAALCQRVRKPAA